MDVPELIPVARERNPPSSSVAARLESRRERDSAAGQFRNQHSRGCESLAAVVGRVRVVPGIALERPGGVTYVMRFTLVELAGVSEIRTGAYRDYELNRHQPDVPAVSKAMLAGPASSIAANTEVPFAVS